MNTALIITFGFDEKFCYRAIMRNRIKDGDRIILLTAGVVEKVKRAYELVRNFISTTYKNVEVELVELNPRDFVFGVEKVATLIKNLENYEIVVNLSGGMRILSLMVYAALTLIDKDAKVEIELEDFSGVVELPKEIFTLPKVLSKLSSEKIELIRIAKEKWEVSAMKLAEALGKDVTTIRRHIYELERLKLVEIVSRKPLKVRLREIGGLV
uniref:CRISPR locus-related DNA-binding protein n=1 Tax=Geoglobus ahangari TaxID=113653 RepID=A0A7J3TJ28_9EURY